MRPVLSSETTQIFDNLVMNLSAEFKSVRDRSNKNGESLWRFTERHGAESTIGFKFVHDRFCLRAELSKHIKLKGLILAQNERLRRGLGMQVVRESPFGERTAAKGRVTRGYIPSGPG